MTWPSLHFERREFACHCGCGFDSVDAELLEVLEELRHRFGGVPVMIASGARCQAHNQAVGGAAGSQHVLAKAADIQVAGIHPSQVFAWLTSHHSGRYGVGDYMRWTHIDVRRIPARW